MILATGLTPAWQQILVFNKLHVGQVNRAKRSVWCGSGKVLNVGASLCHLGANTVTLSPVGGATGQQIKADFLQKDIQARWIETEHDTRVCTTILDESTGIATELVENSAPITEHELDRYSTAFDETARNARYVVFSGSLPKGVPSLFPKQLLKSTNAQLILDIRGDELKSSLSLHPLLVKPNREELSTTVNRPLSTEEEVIDAMDEVRLQGAEWVVVSDGGNPIFVLGPSGITRITPPQVPVLNPIGCGDALTAGIAFQLSRQAAPLDAISFGVEYAARKASHFFPTLLTN